MKKVLAVILLLALIFESTAQTGNTQLLKKGAMGKGKMPMEKKLPGFPLAGTWLLKAAGVVLPDGTHATDPGLGKDAQGVLMIDRQGQYSLQIFKAERMKFASGDKRLGTAEEYASAVLGMSTHTGHIKMDTVNKTLQFNIDNAAFPNWDHTTQIRQYKLSGDELYYQLPANAGAGTVAASTWQRVIPE